MDTPDEIRDRRHRHLVAALIFGTPWLAIAMTLGVALTDIYLLPTVNLPDLGADWIVPINAGLAFAGAVAGGLCVRTTAGVRVALGLAVGLIAIAAYFGVMITADTVIPGF